jgi:hypothetical protein
MVFEELEVLTDQAVREAGRDADLVEGEALLVKEDDTGKVLDIAFNGGLGMMGTAFDIGELIAGEIETEDLSFVGLPAAHLVSPTARGKNDPLATHLAHVALDGDDTGGEDKGNILIGEQPALIDGFIGDAEDLVLPKTAEARLFVDGQVFLRKMKRKLNRDLLAQGDGLPGRFILLDSQVLKLSGTEVQLSMVEKVLTDLREVSRSQDRGEVEVPSNA